MQARDTTASPQITRFRKNRSDIRRDPCRDLYAANAVVGLCAKLSSVGIMFEARDR